MMAQVTTNEIVQFRIEAVGNGTYQQESSFPIRCRFRNTSEKPVAITLPGHSTRQTLLADSLGLEINIRKENETTPLIHSDLGSEFCKRITERLDSQVECGSPQDKINLPAHEEFVRTIHLSTVLGGQGEFAKRMQPGKYLIQINSNQSDSTLISNEIAIFVQSTTPQPSTTKTKVEK
jgi:hypothetical protein